MKRFRTMWAVALLALCLGVGPVAHAALCKVGDRAEVEWKGKWYPAQVTKVNKDGTQCFIRYDGYGSDWDEWVGKNRIVLLSGYQVGDAVEVEWKGKWYPARVLKVSKGTYFIHYDGYESSWDEWVGPKRIR